MPYPQDLVGKFIGYQLDMGTTPSPEVVKRIVVKHVLTGRVTDADVPVYQYNAGLPGGSGRPPVPARWINTNANWSFTFLKYVGGAVTVAPRQKAVLTGPMSGCYLFKYTGDGAEKVAHVGTADTSENELTILAKESWLALHKQKGVTVVASGANPWDLFKDDDVALTAAILPNGRPPLVVGYFDRYPGSAYAMLLSPVPQTMNPPVTPMLKVSALKDMPLLSWNTIRNQPKFRPET